jgi:uncharacterized protein YdcH (DUF465 family)
MTEKENDTEFTTLLDEVDLLRRRVENLEANKPAKKPRAKAQK